MAYGSFEWLTSKGNRGCGGHSLTRLGGSAQCGCHSCTMEVTTSGGLAQRGPAQVATRAAVVAGGASVEVHVTEGSVLTAPLGPARRRRRLQLVSRCHRS
mmetsp:Transcript_39675/g.84655  ORF Transcript_39675/g.84655 Transcript_39675/m.84655 type:complete len:100 (+) Transcript_39675:1547-1846(+)